ncbi:MAG: nucleotidyltransferase family protein [Erysipelotrichaceae bacterium]|nr:nucleotidyltransferase family protein [Erysipelotrichaceae bacterium]
MNITGIVVEYNPFHNGHIYHLNKAKELTDADITIAVSSGNFTQRGEISIIDKYQKCEEALKAGVDLFVELPYIYTVQNASVFGEKSVEILKMLGINNLVFGSETGNMEELLSFARHSINIDHLKEALNKGESYPKAYGLLAGSIFPNDILAISYLRALEGTDIKPIAINRTNTYKGLELEEIASARAIREAVRNNLDYSIATPTQINEPLFNEDIYPYLQRKLLSSSVEEIRDIFLVSEGIENLLIKNAQEYDTYEDFVSHSVSKRYTRARINRICINILNNIKKEEVKDLEELNYVRVLGFNEKGREYLRRFRDDENIKIVTQFKNIPENHKKIEWKVANMYASFLKDRKAYLLKELKGPIIR